MNIGAIIQARSGSSRLPGKIYEIIGNKTILKHVCERVREAKMLNDVILVMPEYDRRTIYPCTRSLWRGGYLPEMCFYNDESYYFANRDIQMLDGDIEEVKRDLKLDDVFFGDEQNVLSRYFYAARKNRLDLIVRITADCPLVLPELIDEMVMYYLENQLNCFLCNGALRQTNPPYPDGFDVEIFPYWILCKAFKNATEKEDLEHVCTWMWRKKNVHVELYNNEAPHLVLPCIDGHFSVDEPEHLELVRKVYAFMQQGNSIQRSMEMAYAK